MGGSSIGAACLALALCAQTPAADPADGRDADLESLAAELRARHPKSRRGAVRALADIGTPAAWRLVAQALEDPESEVGDEAQLRIAGVVDPRTRGELLGSLGLDAPGERARARVAEALGRMAGPLEARELSKALGMRDGEATRLALWSIERLASRAALAGDRSQLVARVEQLASVASEGGVRAAALAALAALEPPRALRLVHGAFQARHAEVRAAALAIGLLAPDEDLRARLAAAVRDPSAGVRCQAIVVLESLADRSAVGVLVELLEREPRPRVAERAVAALQRLSGLKHRRDPRPWRDWCAGLPADWRPAGAAPAVSEDSARTTVAANFGGLSIVSDRLSFLVDFSGSMWAPRDDGRSVKSVVDARLALGLEGLAPTARFNLMPFSNAPVPWEDALVDARPANRRRALEFFVACRAQGRGNLYDAVLAALADEEVDTLMIWSDGVPTGGSHSRLELVVPLLAERNRFRHVAFDLVLVDAPSSSVKRFGELARSSGGRLLAVSLDELAGVSAKGG